jgi:L-ribulose-5-phosphate 3-epimerase
VIVSFMSANYVARCTGYRMTEGWGQGDRTTNEYFRPLETYAERFGEMLSSVRAMGFEAIDIWTPHLNWTWATEEHRAIARDLLGQEGLALASMAGGFGETTEEFHKACELAVSVGASVLGGNARALDTNREEAIGLLAQNDLRLGIENHPEFSTPEIILEKIGDGGHGRIGTAIDTGWYATYGIDAAKAIERLGPHIVHVHLKDVLAEGSHETCRFGRGVVPLERCVRALQAMGYTGALSVEHEPEMEDPTEDCKESLAMLQGWLAS